MIQTRFQLALAIALLSGVAAAQTPVDVEHGIPPAETIGLLQWTAVTGLSTADCADHPPNSWPVFASAHGSKRIADLFPVVPTGTPGVCRGARLHWLDGGEDGVPIREHDYEEISIPVSAQDGARLRLALDKREAWIEPGADVRLRMLPELLQARLAYLPAGREVALCDSPDTVSGCRQHRVDVAEAQPVRVLSSQLSSTEVWLQIELLDVACALDESRVIDRGWIPAIGTDHRVNAWFWSRGC